MDKEGVVHIYNGKLLSQKTKEVFPFTVAWMDLEGITVSEISQREKEKQCTVSLIRRI